jgi:hypothetical protein
MITKIPMDNEQLKRSYTMRDKDVTILALLLLRDVNDDIDDK